MSGKTQSSVSCKLEQIAVTVLSGHLSVSCTLILGCGCSVRTCCEIKNTAVTRSSNELHVIWHHSRWCVACLLGASQRGAGEAKVLAIALFSLPNLLVPAKPG